jgi:glycosyltransferase involved in cell wall biosynthesis
MITLVYAYYENPSMLRFQLENWGSYYSRGFQIIIVDDGSPNTPAAPILRAYPIAIPVRCYRIEQNIPWNQDGARNLGMMQCETEWAHLLDMDLVLTPIEAAKALHFQQNEAKPREYYMPARVNAAGQAIPPHPNSYLFRRADFWHMGGYDEDFAGCYGSDGNFRKCARAEHREIQTAAWHLVMYGRDEINDASTRDFGRKESKYWRPNFPHLEAKRRASPYKASNHLRFNWREEIIR